MVPISDRWSATPYAGIRYSRIKAHGYSETLNNDRVTTPLTFADLTQKSTTALLGAKLHTQINDRLNILASVGMERDLHYTGGRYLGTGDVETSSIEFNPNSNQTRMNASIGAYFDVAKKQRIGANIFWTEQPFTDKNSTSLFVNYTLGL
jgi:outer membrane autotransporter protein